MPVIVGVALGGALGASARYGARPSDRAVELRGLSRSSTFTINVTGCFLIGVVSAALVDRHHLPAWLRIGLVVGVVGGYTTFSTFAQETLDLGEFHHVLRRRSVRRRERRVGLAAVYAGGVVGRF